MNVMSDKPVWASKDETVTCVQGHTICTVMRDIHFGDPPDRAFFGDWQQPVPSDDTQITEIRCKRCRGVWVRWAQSRAGQRVIQFHFPEGWR